MNAVSQTSIPDFGESLRANGLSLGRLPLEILQINVGKRCNQACHHCHVDAGPKRIEMMNARTTARVIELMRESPHVRIVDITGGAPELNPHFRELVLAAYALGKQIIDRCNLTVLLEPGQEDTAQFLAIHGVGVVASLPCYSKANVEKQRGLNVFGPSIAALQKLNALGYGRADSGLELNLVYNPGGAFLPPPQAALEADYRRELGRRFGIVFNQLYTITNMPISRFLHALERDGEFGVYMQKLLDAFNPQAALGVMCRNLVSVSWDGQLYDCDFNQMLELPLGDRPRTIWEIAHLGDLEREPIAFASHCYGCTAGPGSSCGGALT